MIHEYIYDTYDSELTLMLKGVQSKLLVSVYKNDTYDNEFFLCFNKSVEHDISSLGFTSYLINRDDTTEVDLLINTKNITFQELQDDITLLELLICGEVKKIA